LEIFGSRRQRVLRQLDHQRVVRRFPLALPGALLQLIVFAASFFYLVEDEQLGVIAKIDATGVFTGNRSEDIFAQRHIWNDLNNNQLYCSDDAAAG
jgi:hypothetical protein